MKHHDIENVCNISRKSKVVFLLHNILDNSNLFGIRLDYMGSWENYMSFNHPHCQTGLDYYHNTSNERERQDSVTLYTHGSLLASSWDCVEDRIPWTDLLLKIILPWY